MSETRAALALVERRRLLVDVEQVCATCRDSVISPRRLAVEWEARRQAVSDAIADIDARTPSPQPTEFGRSYRRVIELPEPPDDGRA